MYRKRKNRVYEGRFKGSTETHMPNDVVRERMDEMGKGGGLPSYVPYKCDDCGLLTRVHKLEAKIYRCSCGSLNGGPRDGN